MSLVTYDVHDHVATITMNRPEARNAINGAMRTGLNAAWERFRGDEDAWVAILAASGDVFCAGGDLKDGEGSVGTFAGTFWEKPRSTRSSPVWSSTSRRSPRCTGRALATG